MSEGDHLEDPSINGTITLKWISQEVVRGNVEWNDLVQDWDRWQAVVNEVMNHQVQ
jgi:hypothetical protein